MWFGFNIWIQIDFETNENNIIECKVITPTIDGDGLVVLYLKGWMKNQIDFVFEDEIDFDNLIIIKE